ncbi:hypothetical protein ILUMI_22964 [Ignelater luminosus]|uniref:Transcription factor Dp-1 n=1 Tax=Ignelater luminosus TaxID=2038154 RepID=A0A8K0CDE8_IGNLU|nr:hypothetical protein ILUMI_22964 [Ignelater luminosus]
MAQQNNTSNWVFQDANGQPQMIKLVQAGGKPISGIMTSTISGQTIKILKSAQPDQDGSQTINTTGSQVLKLGTASKIITKAVPVGTFRYARAPDGQYIQKTIRIAPSQMQNVKLISTSTPQKIQTIQAQTPPVIQQSPIQNQKNYISPPILDHSGARKRQDTVDTEYAPEYKRRKTEKVGKGLRHFSMKVCEKVRKKGTTSYNEVADELVGEFTSSLNNSVTDQQYDQKNIRRRVYDALNVLMAMNIISKEKKEIRWLGLPTNSLQECIQLEKEKQKRIQSIKEKTRKLHDLILNQIAFKNLAMRNKNTEAEQGSPAPNSYIELPFIVVNTNKKTVIDCSISNDKMEYMFQFSDKFQIHDDVFVLKEIGMLMGLDKGECSPEDLEKIKTMVPKALEDYVIQLANRSPDQIEQILESAGAGPSNVPLLNAEDLVETQMDEENSLQSSSCDPLSPNNQDFSDEEGESDTSSDVETN